MQFIEPNTYIADEGKVFQRINNGFNPLDPPIGYFTNLTLGQILVDGDGNPLETPIPDKIEYYEEIEMPSPEIPE